MPHITLEHSTNIIEPVDSALLRELNSKLAEFDTFKLPEIKSRAIPCEHHCIGEGDQNTAFIHLQLAVMPGRTKVLLNAASTQLLSFLKEAFPESMRKFRCSFTVEVRELDKETYVKATS